MTTSSRFGFALSAFSLSTLLPFFSSQKIWKLLFFRSLVAPIIPQLFVSFSPPLSLFFLLLFLDRALPSSHSISTHKTSQRVLTILYQLQPFFSTKFARGFLSLAFSFAVCASFSFSSTRRLPSLRVSRPGHSQQPIRQS